MVGQQKKFWFLEPLKHLFHHSQNTFFLKKINIRRKNTCSQCLIPFMKIRLCKLSLRGTGNLLWPNLSLRPVMMLQKGVYHQENQNICLEFQHLFKANHFWPCTVTTQSKPSHAGFLLITWRTCKCSNVQLQKFIPTNTWKINFANYLHLQMEKLLMP